MRYFAKRVILPFLKDGKYSNICEIGALVGGHTDQLIRLGTIRLTVIDPCISADLSEKYKDLPGITMFKGLSLDVLPQLPAHSIAFLSTATTTGTPFTANSK